MNHKMVAYTLVSYAHLGCLPECVLVDTDAQGIPGARSVKLKKETLPQQTDWMDQQDIRLAELCFQLDPDCIAKKVNYGKNRSWSDIERLLANTRSNDETTLYFRNYLIDYVQKRMDRFFQLVGTRPLYFPVGKFPFMWTRIHRVEDVPELMYCFDNQPDKIVYSLDIRLNNRPLSIAKGVLVTQSKARILVADRLYEFDPSVDGMKLVPFFTKPFVTVLQSNAPDYIEKVIMPLTTTNRVVAKGFDIQLISGMSNAVLRVRENKASRQLSLFDATDGTLQSGEVVLELLFEYENFRFWAGQGAKTTRLEMSDDSFTITKVERDKALETEMIGALRQLGIDLDGRIKKMSYTDGIDFINQHLKTIESAGIDVQFEASGEANRFFIGEQ